MMGMVVADLMAKMGLDLSAFDRNLDHAHGSASRFARTEFDPNLGLDDSEFDRKLAQDKKKMSSLGDGLRGKLGSIVSTGALAGVAAVGTGMAAGIYTGIKYNSTIEQTTIAMGVMLGSTEKAVALIGEVEKMSAATPFQFDELADATKRLVAYGFAAGEAVPLLTSLGDISSALQIPIGEMSDLYGKMKVSGRITMEDMNQLAGRGVPIYKALAGEMGVGQEEIRGLVEAGKVGFPQIERAISRMTSKGGMFAGMMAKQSKSFAGLGSTLADTITMALGDAMKPAFEWLKKTMDKQLNDPKSTLMQFMDVIKNSMPGLAKSAKDIAQALAPLGYLFKKISEVETKMPWLKEAMMWMQGPALQTGYFFGELVKFIQTASGFSSDLYNNLKNAVAELAKLPGSMLGAINPVNLLPGFASGVDMITRGPTPFIAGEAGPERVTVTPIGKQSAGRGGGDVHVHIGTVVGTDERAARQLADMVGRHIMRGVSRGLVGQNA